MGVALLSANRSKDPNTQVGACLVNEDKKIIGIGYNGFPRGCSYEEFPWGKGDNNPLNTKYPYVVHAEANAILNSNANLKGSILYVSLFPCNECAKLIIQSGVKKIIYMSDKYSGTPMNLASKKMLDSAGVIYETTHEIEVFVKYWKPLNFI
jgi:dCMP deaminase